MRHLFSEKLKRLREWQAYCLLPSGVKAEQKSDADGLPEFDSGQDTAVDEGIRWLCRAQDNSLSHDGGVARHYSLISGWGSSYPETTGYIVPTMIAYARNTNRSDILQRARRMLDWLVSIQLPEGAFQGSVIDAKPVVPVTFNTGQVLIGLASGVTEFRDYTEAMCRAADWLIQTQDSDGCWRNPSPFTRPGDKVYETHVAWGLFEAARHVKDAGYAEAAMANIRWALTHQQSNGWFDQACLTDASRPLTHTLGYTLRGILEAYRFSESIELLEAARCTADGLITAIDRDGFLPGRLDCHWHGTVHWACLTGTVQVAICWLMLYKYTGVEAYHRAAFLANRYVRRTMKTDVCLDVRGAIKGSFPVDGEYCRYQYPNWATKFFVDANMLEQQLGAT